MFFEVNEAFLSAVKNLEGDPNWYVIKKHITDVSRRQTNDTLHNFPKTFDDVRFHINQGIAIAMDVLQGILNDPDSLMDDLKIIDKMNEVAAKSVSGEDF